jgi:hypothetical protein
MTERFARISEHAIRCRELSGSDWRVLACISLHGDSSGRAYPGMTTLSEMTGIRRRDLPRTIRRLVQLGLLRCDTGAGPNGANLYTLQFEPEVSAALRTVRNGADPQDCDGGVRNTAAKVSAALRTKQTIEQTIKHIRPRKRAERHFVSTPADVRFEEFWRVFPKRGEHTNPKKPARPIFLAAIDRGVDPERIIRAAGNYAEAMRRSSTPGRYIKQAQYWLKDELWDQYAEVAEPEPLRAGMV